MQNSSGTMIEADEYIVRGAVYMERRWGAAGSMDAAAIYLIKCAMPLIDECCRVYMCVCVCMCVDVFMYGEIRGRRECLDCNR